MPRRPAAFAPGCLRTLDEATIGRAILHAGAAVARVDCVEQDETAALANARHRLSEVQGRGLVVLRCFEKKECTIVQPLIIIGEESAVDLKGLWHGDILTTLGPPARLALSASFLPLAGR